MSLYMGIDIGTSSVKTLIINEKGEKLAENQQSYDINKPYISYAEQDINVLWKATKETIKAVISILKSSKNEIASISFSGQMHGLVMVDQYGNSIRDTIIWSDQRSQQEIDEIYNIVDINKYRNLTLNSLSTGFLLSSLMWVKKNEPMNFNKIDKIMLPKDYIRYKLCGEIATDDSDASGSGIYDTANRVWAWELIDQLELPRDIFPECFSSSDIAGVVTDEASTETGLAKGIKVVYGGGDSLMQAVGNGIIEEGILSSNIGTASQISCSLNQPMYDLEFRTNTFCHVDRDKWMIMGANLNGGICQKWLKNNILGYSTYDEMSDLAASVPPGSEGLLFLPYLNGERTPHNDPNAKAIYFGFTLIHSKAHMIRSTLEGVGFALKNSLEIFTDMGIECKKVIASGGGARSEVLLQIQADMLEKEIHLNYSKEQACVGAAITAAVGIGDFSSYKEACRQMVKFSDKIVYPEQDNIKIYRELYDKYKELYPRNKDLF